MKSLVSKDSPAVASAAPDVGEGAHGGGGEGAAGARRSGGGIAVDLTKRDQPAREDTPMPTILHGGAPGSAPMRPEGSGGVTGLDDRFRRLTAIGNSAFAAGDDTDAARLYDAALAEADRLFELALSGGGPAVSLAATLLAPLAHNVACHNVAELRRRGQDRAGAFAHELRAVERLVAAAERPSSPVFLRVNCVRHVKFALASLADHLRVDAEGADPADRGAIAALLARARAAVVDVAKVTRVLAEMKSGGGGWPGGARDAGPVDMELAAALCARAFPEVGDLIGTAEALTGAVPEGRPGGARKLSS